MKRTLLALVVMGSVCVADEMDDFVGGVYDGGGVYAKAGNVAAGSGAIINAGNVYFTPNGVYIQAGDTYLGPKTVTVRSGDSFIGSGFVAKAGNVYAGTSTAVVAGVTIIKPAWSSR